jgi:outer membrane protein OmpA-like peptidoglycan-associated protein
MVDVATGKVYALSKTDADGEFLLCLPMDKDYGLNVNRPQYLFYSDNFALKAEHKLRDPYVLKIPLQPVKDPIVQGGGGDNKESEPIVLKNVFFATSSAELRPESKNELDKLKQLLDDNPKMRIRLNGHTDSEGNDADNLNLSDRRAHAVRTFLINKGILAARLEAKGFGETKPIASNDTPEGRQENRRTEFVVLN